MPSTANIVVADAVPANHTYEPRSTSQAQSTWAESTAAIFEGNGRFSASLSPPSTSRKTTRSKFVLSIPVVRTVDGEPVVTDTLLYTVETVLPTGVTPTEATNGYTQFKNMVANALVQSYIASGVAVW